MKYTIICQRTEQWRREDGDVALVQAWRKQIGDAVRAGDAIATLALPSGDTIVEVISPAFGILAKKVVLPGEAVEIGEAVAVLAGVPESFVSGGERVPLATMSAYVPQGPESVRTLTASEATLARALAASSAAVQTTLAHTDVTEALRMAAKMHLPLLPFVLHTVAETLTRHPDLNAQWVETEENTTVRQKQYVNLGLAHHGAGGLRVAVIHNAHHKSLRALVQEVSRLQTARDDGSLTAEERRGATFIVSEAPSGIAFQSGLLHSPLAAHLTLGSVDSVGERSRLTLCLTHDARIAAPEHAAAFLADVCQGLADSRFLFAG